MKVRPPVAAIHQLISDDYAQPRPYPKARISGARNRGGPGTGHGARGGVDVAVVAVVPVAQPVIFHVSISLLGVADNRPRLPASFHVALHPILPRSNHSSGVSHCLPRRRPDVDGRMLQDQSRHFCAVNIDRSGPPAPRFFCPLPLALRLRRPTCWKREQTRDETASREV